MNSTLGSVVPLAMFLTLFKTRSTPLMSLCWYCQNTEMQSSLFTTRLFAGWTRWSTQWSAILVTKPILRAGLWGRLLRKWCFPPTLPTTPISSSTTALLSGQSRQSIMAILAGLGGIIFFPEKGLAKSKLSGRPADLHPLARDEEALRWEMFFWVENHHIVVHSQMGWVGRRRRAGVGEGCCGSRQGGGLLSFAEKQHFPVLDHYPSFNNNVCSHSGRSSMGSSADRYLDRLWKRFPASQRASWGLS